MKITEAKLKWLKDNKIHGEVAETVRRLNPTGKSSGISNPEALSIINGKLWGKWGPAFTTELEKVIRERLNKETEEKQQYATQ